MNAGVALNSRTNQLIESRRDRLVSFINKLKLNTDEALSTVKIEINNNWSNPPMPSTVKEKYLLGGTTYQYQVWAVIR
jgi:hypothetical protein